MREPERPVYETVCCPVCGRLYTTRQGVITPCPNNHPATP